MKKFYIYFLFLLLLAACSDDHGLAPLPGKLGVDVIFINSKIPENTQEFTCLSPRHFRPMLLMKYICCRTACPFRKLIEMSVQMFGIHSIRKLICHTGIMKLSGSGGIIRKRNPILPMCSPSSWGRILCRSQLILRRSSLLFTPTCGPIFPEWKETHLSKEL